MYAEGASAASIGRAMEIGEGERGEPKRGGLRAKLKVRLNRLIRRTRRYGKRLYMPVGSLAMAPLRNGLRQRKRV